ncbi:TolC family outer membrane protein [Serratia quinivorans]|uniref:TolC family outer membrane protein n=1 Tax=Serratia quinivorans TaxID=137545 RepID=UPI00217A315F|nr:TolC family outer membrane protein [Serratia quinivorans]CAI2135884.1 Outer membrane protein tolC precursor [Serratia quinivorans]CAI2143258.1 Outer membrane protein tolC precursor [Serratia quinivorans]
MIQRIIIGVLATLLAACWIYTTPAYALTLKEAFILALHNDPALQAAVQEKLAGEEDKAIGRAGLLPQVSANYQNAPRNWQNQKYQGKDIFGQSTGEQSVNTQYSSHSLSLTVTQQLFDYEAWARYQGGIARALMADERYRGQFQDMAARLVEAYIDVAYRRENITLTQAQVATYGEQLALNQRLNEQGEGTITDVAETQARYSLAQTQLIEAQDALNAAQGELSNIIGVPTANIDAIEALRGPFTPLELKYPTLEAWQQQAKSNNPTLRAARQGIDVAHYEVERNRAGHFPRVALYASHSENESSSDNTVGQQYRTDSIGVQVSVPLYAGGGVTASTEQAAARYMQAKYEMAAQSDKTLSDLQRQYSLCLISEAKLKAYELALQAADKQVVATRESVRAGMRVNVDVLNAEQQRYTTQKDYAEAKYGYLKAWVALQSLAGVLNEEDITQVAHYFR